VGRDVADDAQLNLSLVEQFVRGRGEFDQVHLLGAPEVSLIVSVQSLGTDAGRGADRLATTRFRPIRP
jgi:hypothetical protein